MQASKQSSSTSLDQDVERLLAKLNLKLVFPFLIAFLFFAAWNRGVALLYGVLSFVLVTYLISLILPRLNLKGLKAEIDLPNVIYEGKPLDIGLLLEKSGVFPSYSVQVQLDATCSNDSENRFFLVQMIYKNQQATLTLFDHYRGRHSINTVIASTGFPIGLYQHSKHLMNKGHTFLVLPEVFPIQSLNLMATSQNEKLSQRSLSKVGGNDLYLGQRAYRPGDPLKKIHWPASAKKNELLIKEFENLTHKEITLLLDLSSQANAGVGRENAVEYAIKIAASISKYALNNGFIVNIIGQSKDRFLLSGLNHSDRFWDVLCGLAELKAEGEMSYQTLVNEFLVQRSNSQMMILFDHEYQHQLVHYFENYLTFRFDRNSFVTGFDSHKVLSSKQPSTYSYEVLIQKGDELRNIFE